MKFKKALAMVLAGAMALSLAACGGNRNSESTDDNKEKSNSGELSVSIWDSYQEPGIKEILADFTEETGNELPRSKLRGIEGCNLYI